MTKPDLAVATSTKIKFDDSDDDHDSTSEDEGEIEKELADVTFEELQRAKSDGSEMVYRKFKSENKVGGRANKNRPMEMSSKKRVSRYREVIQVPKKVVRDPRFESLCGRLDVEGFKKRYGFLYENEFPGGKEDKQLKSAVSRRTDREILAEHKKKEREAAKQGKKPYYLKKSEIRKEKLIDKYKELKASGKLESFIEKKRKRNASKDHRYMPYRRLEGGDQ
ncbi:uncharacterized protein [Coffea arabica]|uniref:rRNA biogenesis protein RRP36 n=1 Tax=Coffea arabica TaxID=13443 RepID=A0A6P6U6K7_COFAR|nr:ribosomal RNA processing protein 36 homolog [Coffea arabica]XP_027085622.1 ribosomal RNA processing protein 36 homolog [Coffea arabica]